MAFKTNLTEIVAKIDLGLIFNSLFFIKIFFIKSWYKTYNGKHFAIIKAFKI